VPVIAKAELPPITIPLTVPPVRTALLEFNVPLAVNVPVTVPVAVVIELGLMPISIMFAEASSV
jgi:hypothetical protein